MSFDVSPGTLSYALEATDHFCTSSRGLLGGKFPRFDL